jgi:hypothetical protein
MQKVSVLNKKIKSFFFGASAMNDDNDAMPEKEVKADFKTPNTLATPNKLPDEYRGY